jgi:hypothetical protein
MAPRRKKIVKIQKQERVLGLAQRKAKVELREMFNQVPGLIKFFRIPLKRERIIAVHHTSTGHQLIYELKKSPTGLRAILVGEFTSDFGHRIVKDPTLRRRGIASALLDVEKVKRSTQTLKKSILSYHKSTTLFLLKQGYVFDTTKNRLAEHELGIKSTKDLIRFLQDPKTPENYRVNVELTLPTLK